MSETGQTINIVQPLPRATTGEMMLLQPFVLRDLKQNGHGSVDPHARPTSGGSPK